MNEENKEEVKVEEPQKPAEPAPAPKRNKFLEEAREITELKAKNDELAKENDELKEAHKEMIGEMLNNRTPRKEEAPKLKTAKECRHELEKVYQRRGNNLEFAKAMVELNDAVKREEGRSVWEPKGRNLVPTYEEKMRAERMESIFKHCLEVAGGDPDAFDAEYAKYVKKDRIPPRFAMRGK